MIHYHGTPLSGTRADVANFVAGRHVLIPYLRKDDLSAAAEFASSFVFDNSAYSSWKRGVDLDFEGYTRWCHNWRRHPGLEWCLIPDTITGTEEENDYLIKQWPRDIPGVPVYHLSESVERLKRLCRVWPIVALGSSGAFKTPGTQIWHERMRLLFTAICDEFGRPRTKIHGLRMMDFRIVAKYPFRSADSTTVAQGMSVTALFGHYPPPSPWQRAVVIASRIEATNSPSVFKV